MQYQFVHNEQHVCMNVYYVHNVHVIIIHVRINILYCYLRRKEKFSARLQNLSLFVYTLTSLRIVL